MALHSLYLRTEGQLDFLAMDEFMDVILRAINEHGARAVRIFPPASQVLLLFSERLANEVVRTVLLIHYFVNTHGMITGRRIYHDSPFTRTRNLK